MANRYGKHSARRRTSGLVISLGAAGCSVLAFSCLAEGDGTPSGGTAMAEVAMVGGTAVSVEARRELGLVSIRGGSAGDCSGAIVSANWVITSENCVRSIAADRVHAPRSDGTLAERAILENVKLPEGSIMMLRLGPASADMDWPIVTRGSSEASVSAGQQVTCYGRGGTSTTDGEREWLLLTRIVNAGSTSSFSIKSSYKDERLDSAGDIGGPCLYNNQFVGITSYFRRLLTASGGSGGVSGSPAAPMIYESVHDATPRLASLGKFRI